MRKHTPGPWTYGVRKDGSIWLSLGDPHDPRQVHYQGDIFATPADAALITAAPDLLASLRDLADFTETNFRRAMGFTPAADLEKEVHNHKLLAPARAAIAKAEGR